MSTINEIKNTALYNPLLAVSTIAKKKKKYIVQFIHTKIFSFSRDNAEQNLTIVRIWEISTYSREKSNPGVH